MFFPREPALLLMATAIFFAGCSAQQQPAQNSPRPQATERTDAQTKPVEPGDVVRAASNGDFALVRSLISSGANVNEALGSGETKITALIAASANGHKDIARYLIAHGADRKATYLGYTAGDFEIFGDSKFFKDEGP